MHQQWRTFARVGSFFVAIGLTMLITQRLTAWITAGPEQYCKTTPISESWRSDHAYKATVLKKDCNQDESVFYSVRLDALSPPRGGAWFMIIALESDDDHPAPPTLTWVTPQQLEITMETANLGGQLADRVSDNLVVTRIFNAKKASLHPQ